MTPAEINKVATITERLTTANLAAKRTSRELNNLHFETYGIITPQEMAKLKEAEEVLSRIIDRTSSHSIQEFIVKVLNNNL